MPGDKWDGKISNLNISDQAFPELHAELSKMHHKARSDRLRQISVRMTTPELSTSALPPVHPPVTLENDGINSKRQSLKDSLLGSV